MTQDQLKEIAEQLAEQLYIQAGRGTPLTVPWDSPHMPGPTRSSWERQAAAAVFALDRLGLLREP